MELLCCFIFKLLIPMRPAWLTIRRKKILRDALKSAEQKGVKIHNLVSSRPAHTLWMIVEAETFEAIDEMFEPIRAMTDAVINPVMALPAS